MVPCTLLIHTGQFLVRFVFFFILLRGTIVNAKPNSGIALKPRSEGNLNQHLDHRNRYDEQ